MVKTNYGNEGLAFLACFSCKCDEKGLIEQVEGYSRCNLHLTTEEDFRIWFAFYYCSFPKEQHNSTVTELVQFLPDVGCFNIHLFFTFSQKHD